MTHTVWSDNAILIGRFVAGVCVPGHDGYDHVQPWYVLPWGPVTSHWCLATATAVFHPSPGATPGSKSAGGETDCVSNFCLCKHRLGWTRSRFSFLCKPSLFTFLPLFHIVAPVPSKGIFGSMRVWTKRSTKASGVCFLRSPLVSSLQERALS